MEWSTFDPNQNVHRDLLCHTHVFIFFLRERGPIFAETRREEAILIKNEFSPALAWQMAVCVCTSWKAELISRMSRSEILPQRNMSRSESRF
jgi:hypothetical protein